MNEENDTILVTKEAKKKIRERAGIFQSMPEKDKHIQIISIGGVTAQFIDKYIGDKGTNNWHYYEDNEGQTFHFRKEHIISVAECAVDSD